MPRRRPLRPYSPDLQDLDSFDADTSSKHPQRNAANARERARMRVLSKAFCRLKTTLPWVPADTKLSKLDTLRLATSYIAHLRAVLTDQPGGADGQKHPLTLTWPFTFQQNGNNFSSNYDSGTCWINARDSEDEDYQNTSHNHQTQNVSNCQGITKEYTPYYQQFSDNLMHIN